MSPKRILSTSWRIFLRFDDGYARDRYSSEEASDPNRVSTQPYAPRPSTRQIGDEVASGHRTGGGRQMPGGGSFTGWGR